MTSSLQPSGVDLLVALAWPAAVLATGDGGVRVLAANDALCALVRADARELAGKPLAAMIERMPKAWGRVVPDRVETVLHSGVATTVEVLGAQDDGSATMQLSPLRASDGVVRGVLLVACPSPSLRKAEEAIRAAREAADSAVRARAAFVANISHEIRTPIHAILGFSDLLARQPLATEQQEQLASIRHAGTMLHGLLQDVLDLSRLEAGAFTLHEYPIDVGEAVTRALDLHRKAAADKGLSLVAAVPGGLPRVLGDSLRLGQVLANLVGNAVKFTREGEVRVVVSARPTSMRHVDVIVDVIDTGPGVSAEVRDRIFERFAQVDSGVSRRFDGAGLGLSIARELVEHMGGRLELATVPARGSCFRVTLPDRVVAMTTVDEDVEPSPPVAPIDVDARAMSVLVAEDNPVNQRLMARMLQVVGLEADVVGDGRLAVERCLSKRYDLVLMDVAMPEMDGLQATRVIRADGLGRPWIVGVSARVLSQDREAGLSSGMDEYLPKPASLDVLRGAVARAHEARRRAREGRRGGLR